MSTTETVKQSKFLSFVLRHHPESIGLTLDENGWALTSDLIAKAGEHGRMLTLEALKEIVATNDKKRFTFSPDFSKIRASQGHSLQIDLQLKEQNPPAILYHGTAEKNLDSIRQKGLLKGQRQYVHLSVDQESSRRVGMRYGKPVVLTIEAARMQKDGYTFFISENGVWLTETVSPAYIKF